jgi:hypothetical protein
VQLGARLVVGMKTGCLFWLVEASQAVGHQHGGSVEA